MGIQDLPSEALVNITDRLSLIHSFKLWLVGNTSLCRKLLVGGGLQYLRFNTAKLKTAPPLRDFPLMASLTHINLLNRSPRPLYEVDPSFILTLPRNLVFLSLEAKNDHLAFQSAYNQEPERFQHLQTLILRGNGISGNAIFAAETAKFPPNLTKFESFNLVDDSSQLVFPPYLQDLFLRIQGPQGFSSLPDTLERVELRFKSLPSDCPILPASVTWLAIWHRFPETYDAWDFTRLPPALEHLSLYSLNENQINSLPLSLRSLEGLSDYEMKDNEIKSLSRLVNLTSISDFLPFSLKIGLASFLPRRLQSIPAFIPFSDLPSIPSSITYLQLTGISDDSPDPFLSLSISKSDDAENDSLDIQKTPAMLAGSGKEKTEENAVWPFPSLTTLHIDRLTSSVAKRLPIGLENLEVTADTEGITLEVAQQLSNKKLKYLSAGLLQSESCISALPRTLTHLEGNGKIPLKLPATYLVMNTENSSFDLPRSLTRLNLGTIHIDSGTWFNGLPRTLEHLVVGVIGAQETDFGNLNVPPSLTFLELVVHIAPSQGILPLLYSIPKAIKTLRILKVGEKDPGLTNETFGNWIQEYSSIRYLIIPNSRAVNKLCVPMLPKRLKRLELEFGDLSGVPSWAPGYVS
jgi:hypothetical protein